MRVSVRISVTSVMIYLAVYSMHDARMAEILPLHKQFFCYVGRIAVELPNIAGDRRNLCQFMAYKILALCVTLTPTKCRNDRRWLVSKDFSPLQQIRAVQWRKFS